MKKIISLLLALVLAVGVLGGLSYALPMLDADQEAVFDPEAIAAGLTPAPVERSEWSDGILSQVTPDEADGIGSEYADGIPDTDGFGWSGDYINDGGRAPLRAMVSFMDDDCREEAYDLLYQEVIVPMEIPYTLSLPMDKLDTNGYIRTRQLLEMVESGVSISCHTLAETSMAAYTIRGLDAMLSEWRAAAWDLELGEVLSYAYCNGIWSDSVMSAVKSHFRMGFTVDPGINQMPYESYYMKRVGLFSNQAQAVATELLDGTYLNSNGKLMPGTSGQRSTTQPIPVREGEEYLLTCSAVWNGACYAVFNSWGQCIQKQNVPDTARGACYTDLKVRIPTGASYLIVSHNQGVYGDTTPGVQKLPDKSTLHTAKQYVDQVAREGGWLIFMTHAWYRWFDTADLAELVDYIREAGIPIVDVNEAIRISGNVIEAGTFRKPPEYADSPYFVVSAEGRVYTNSLEIPDVPENYENVKLELKDRRVLLGGSMVTTKSSAVEYKVCSPVDVSGCDALLITGWAYDHSGGSGQGYQIYVIKDADGQILAEYTARTPYDQGGELLDHAYVELPAGAATVQIAGNLYYGLPELTRIRRTD